MSQEKLMVLLPRWSVRECSQYGYSWDLESGPIVEVVLLLRWPFIIRLYFVSPGFDTAH